MNLFISFQNIKKQFGNTAVLKEISFGIEKGEIFGLLGLNGAGKTTLMRCFLGLLKLNKGTIYFSGNPIEKKDILEKFGFLPENFLPPKNLKAREFLDILSKGLNSNPERADSLLELVGLKKHQDKYIKTYSRGMIQRLGISCALLKDPEVLVLDEPTLGLDPLGQQHVLDLLGMLNKKGKTIFFSSHTLSQIERICSRIGIINAGQMRYVGPVKDMVKKHEASCLEEAFLKEINDKAEKIAFNFTA